VSARKVDRTVEKDFGQTLPPRTDAHDETGDGPQPVLVVGRRCDTVCGQPGIVRAGSNRAPTRRLADVVVSTIGPSSGRPPTNVSRPERGLRPRRPVR
jgi:hypothetical protein